MGADRGSGSFLPHNVQMPLEVHSRCAIAKRAEDPFEPLDLSCADGKNDSLVFFFPINDRSGLYDYDCIFVFFESNARLSRRRLSLMGAREKFHRSAFPFFAGLNSPGTIDSKMESKTFLTASSPV